MLHARRSEELDIGQEVVARVVARVLRRERDNGGPPIGEVINDTVYHERSRLRHVTNDERAHADQLFQARLRHELPHASEERQRELVREIVARYVAEITGHFDPRVYSFTTRVLPYGLSGLMQSFSLRSLSRELHGPSHIDEHLLLEGEMGSLVRLADHGTIVLVPTHASNLDSLLVGYAIYRMGLPHFVYGAGRNLFTNPLTSFFMRHLGAYTVDRTRSDPLYRETLKEYSTVSLELGQHNLFFPGGTRSRSGELESKIKLGLLGTGLAAYRNNLVNHARRERVFIVPCTISYPLVLEAASLVREFLEETGKSQYIVVEDEFSRIHRWIDFLRGIARLDLRVHVRIGTALDPFGNDVDEEGRSYDPRNRPVDSMRYLLRDGQVDVDPARDAEYTRVLGERVVASYRRDNVALATNVLAFAVLELLRRDLKQPELFRLLRTIGPDTGVAVQHVETEVAKLLEQLRVLERTRKIRLDDGLGTLPTTEVVARGLEGLGAYHTTPVVVRHGTQLVVLDPDLLFYYRNRLEGYGLLDAPRMVAARGAR